MQLYHESAECSVWAVGENDRYDTGIEDTVIQVYRHGASCGYIIARFDGWENELTYIPSAGLPAWIVGLYVGDDYPDSAADQGYTFQD